MWKMGVSTTCKFSGGVCTGSGIILHHSASEYGRPVHCDAGNIRDVLGYREDDSIMGNNEVVGTGGVNFAGDWRRQQSNQGIHRKEGGMDDRKVHE